jgi:hypothetical protein
MTVIGTHVYGAGVKNSASAIGKLGNDYDAMIKAFDTQLPVVQEKTDPGSSIKVKLVRHAVASGPFVPARPTTFNSNGTPINSNSTPKQPGEEGFFDVFRKVSGFVSGALPTIAPLLGPVGGPIAAIAGTALGAIAGRAESAFDDPEEATKASTDRAVLAEAALQTVLNMQDSPALAKVVSHMEECYRENAPNVKILAPKLAPIILDATKKVNPNGKFNQINSRPRATLPPRRMRTDGSESAFGTSDFTAALLQHEARPLEGEEGFFDGLGSLITSGLRAAKPLLREGAKIGLAALSNHLSAESAFDDPTVSAESIQAAELVAQRAIMGEAALQALDKLNKKDLAEAQLTDDPEEEGFFGGFLKIAQKIGGVVKSVAPTVIKAALPIAQTLLAGNQGAAPGAESMLSVPVNGNGLRKKKSLAEMLSNGGIAQLAIGDNRPVGFKVSSGPLSATPAPPPITVVPQLESLASTQQEMEPESPVRVPTLEEVQARYVDDGPDSNEDKPVFEVYDWE